MGVATDPAADSACPFGEKFAPSRRENRAASRNSDRLGELVRLVFIRTFNLALSASLAIITVVSCG